jgi:hypothetical protein
VNPGSRYSRLDRLTHRIAFIGGAVQRTASEIEDLLMGRRLKGVPVEAPIFITSVPRAGTTLILELLHRSPEVGSSLYRDMPFVLAPMLWEAFSGPFRVPARLEERAHGDRLLIGYDSPEALEEVLWKAYWPKWFRGNSIPLWPSDIQSPGFMEAFRSHIKKVLTARGTDDSRPARYLSKNNANVARLGYLRRLFPDATFVLPFRSPLDQAESLRRQHLRFQEIHRRDPFTRRYMGDLGHFEFGELHKPFRFPGMSEVRSRFQPTELDYWVGYVRGAFRSILQGAEHALLVSYEKLCSSGTEGVRKVTDRCGLSASLLPKDLGVDLRKPNRYDLDSGALDKGYLNEAQDLHRQLAEMSVV